MARCFTIRGVAARALPAPHPTYFQVAFLLNEAYDSFMSRFPAFSGNVSIVAHSLGCSIVWEILSKTESSSSLRLRWPLNFRFINPFALTSTLKLSTYPRSVANVFMIGSSLGGYLSLVADPHRSMHATRIVNIFHPLDPLAQRIEPWIDPNVWSEALVSVPLGKLDFPLSSAPQPVSTSAFLERNASLTPRRFVSRFFESCDFCNR